MTSAPMPVPPMLDAFDLAHSRAHVEGEIPLAKLARLAESLIDTDGVLRYQIDGRIDDNGHPGATMRLQARLALACQRCNAPLLFELNRTTYFRFVRSEEELNALPIEDDDVDAVVGSQTMNVQAWIEDEAILSLPLVPRHPQCSPPMQADADTDVSTRSNPFAELAAALKNGTDGATH